MRVIASGLIYDAATAPERRANSAFTGVTALADGTVLVSFRQGSSRGSADGVTAIYASGDAGETWKLRYDGVAETDWEGVAGEMRGLSIRQEPDGTLLGTGLWVDRSGPPRPFGNPDTTGLLPMRMFHTRSRDGGATWDDRRAVPTTPHLGASSCSMPVLDLADGVRAQPYEVWKEWDDPRPAPQAAYLRLSHDRGATWPEYVTVVRDLSGGRYYWDQRIAAHPETGRLVATFWTHDNRVGGPVDVHISWGSADGRTWSEPSPTGLDGQHTQPLAVGGDRLLAMFPFRARRAGDQAGIMVAESPDFGRTWPPERRTVVYRSDQGWEAGAASGRTLRQTWTDMGRWSHGHPRGALLADGTVLIAWYAGTPERTGIRWARLRI